MSIRVEFFGVPRQRAGTSYTIVPAAGPVTLGSVIRQLSAEFPRLATDCFHGDRIQSGYLANLDGQRFIRDPSSLIDDNASLLIMSADAGG